MRRPPAAADAAPGTEVQSIAPLMAVLLLLRKGRNVGPRPSRPDRKRTKAEVKGWVEVCRVEQCL